MEVFFLLQKKLQPRKNSRKQDNKKYYKTTRVILEELITKIQTNNSNNVTLMY